MNYPVWGIPIIGGGLLIAKVAILHVFISHFAIGGGLYLVLTERKAYREKDSQLLEFVKRGSKYFVLITLVLGTLTGVGIWFTIGLVSPAATSILIHTFVWGWAIEWVFFLVEITAAFIYFYAWDRLDQRTHMAIGWIYFGAAWASLVVINGIVSFMLTPGTWIQTHKFIDGFFNPTFLPTLVARTGACIGLAGLYALLAAATMKPGALRDKLAHYSTMWLIPAAAGLLVGGLWFAAMAPEGAKHIVMGGAPAVMIFAMASVAFCVLIFLFSYLGPYRNPSGLSWPFALLLFVMSLFAMGTSEWVREAIRKPYLIYGYLYSNGVFVGQESAISRAGVLKSARWADIKEVKPGDELRAGAEVFRVQCQICHAVDGYNGVRPMVKGWSEEFIDYQLQRLNELKKFMPPFVGTQQERRALAKWLASLNKG